MNVLTCEAGVSIKPGAPAPGSQNEIINSPRKRAIARNALGCHPLSRALIPITKPFLGLAPQALCLHLLRRLILAPQALRLRPVRRLILARLHLVRRLILVNMPKAGFQ